MPSSERIVGPFKVAFQRTGVNARRRYIANVNYFEFTFMKGGNFVYVVEYMDGTLDRIEASIEAIILQRYTPDEAEVVKKKLHNFINSSRNSIPTVAAYQGKRKVNPAVQARRDRINQELVKEMLGESTTASNIDIDAVNDMEFDSLFPGDK